MKQLKGSLTIEAALAMPLFVLAISLIIFWTSFLQTQAELSARAADKAREMAKLAYVTEEEDGNSPKLIEIAKGELLNGAYFERLAVARPFTGRYYSEAETDNAEDNRIVFVTKTGEVYHTSNICSHISLSIREVDYTLVNSLRNKGGAKYYPCEYCAKGNLTGMVYITDEGKKLFRYQKKCKYDEEGRCRGSRLQALHKMWECT